MGQFLRGLGGVRSADHDLVGADHAEHIAGLLIKKVEVQEYEELGMEAIWKIEVEGFPAFVIGDDKGNDFFG